MKTSRTRRLSTVVWMLFVAGIVAEHGYIGYKAHFVLMENQVLKTQLAEAQASERSLATFVKSVLPPAFQEKESEEDKDQKKSSKAAKNPPPPHPGIPLSGKAPQ